MVPWTDEENYVVVQRGSGCNSYVGMIGGAQVLNLDNGCWYSGVIIHEFLHAAGFFHEQSRPDRDQYVEIIWDNIITDKQNQYDIAHGTNTYGLPYDPNSVMHYYNTGFGNGGGYTMISKVPHLFTTEDIGPGDWMTESDITKLKLNYECDGPSCGGA